MRRRRRSHRFNGEKIKLSDEDVARANTLKPGESMVTDERKAWKRYDRFGKHSWRTLKYCDGIIYPVTITKL